MHIEVSIIIPTKNNQVQLNYCLESILNSKKNFTFEIIIVDDHSDKAIEVNKDNVKVVLNNNFRGPAGSRNYGSQIALGKYLFFIDSDAEVEDKALQRLYNSITTEGVDAVFGLYSTSYPYKYKNFLGEYKNLYWHFKFLSLSKNTYLINTSTIINLYVNVLVPFKEGPGKNITVNADSWIEFKGDNDAGEELRIGSIRGQIRSNAKGADTSKIEIVTRKGGQHKSMLTVQNDGIIAHIDAPFVLQNSGWKKTRLFGSATGRRTVTFPDQSGTVMLNESGKVMAADLPTSDPNNAGQLWNDSGTVKISAG